MKRWAAFVLLAAGAVPSAAAEEITLRGALALAAARNVRVVTAQERARAAAERISEGRSPLFPQVTATASQSRQTRNLLAQGFTLPGRDPVIGPFDSFDARLRLTQTLFDAAAWSRLEAARTGRALSQAEEDLAREDALALAAALYLEARRAAQIAALNDTLWRQASDREGLSRTREQAGLGTELEVSQAESALALAQEARRNAASQALERRLDLAAALGIETDIQISTAEESVPLGPAPLRDEEIPAAIDKHPDVIRAQRLVEARAADQETARVERGPKLSGLADYGWSGQRADTSRPTYGYGVQASWPLTDGGHRRSRVEQAASGAREAQASLDDARRRARTKILSSRENLARARGLSEAREKDRAAARETLRVAQARRKLGSGSRWDVTTAASDAARAEDAFEEARANLILAQMDWARSLGVLTTWVEEDKQ